MPASMATKLGIQFARFAQYTAASAATNNASTHGLRGAFASSSGSAPAYAPGLGSGSNATGIGGAKFQAGKGAHSSFQVSAILDIGYLIAVLIESLIRTRDVPWQMPMEVQPTTEPLPSTMTTMIMLSSRRRDQQRSIAHSSKRDENQSFSKGCEVE
jgi:hypothetical protein